MNKAHSNDYSPLQSGLYGFPMLEGTGGHRSSSVPLLAWPPSAQRGGRLVLSLVHDIFVCLNLTCNDQLAFASVQVSDIHSSYLQVFNA